MSTALRQTGLSQVVLAAKERFVFAIIELGFTKGDVTVRTCLDADRLDLGRVRRRPNPIYLCTEFAKQKETIEWAYKRSGAD